ncbi:MAG: hypothetical protein AAF384_10725 [Pseudomonadota bacterium]
MKRFAKIKCALIVCFASAVAVAADGKRALGDIDFIGSAYLPSLGQIVVAGHNGVIGTLTVDGDNATLNLMETPPEEDFTALGKIDDSRALVGSATGKLYSYDGTQLEELAAISEYEDPILDIERADDGVIWAVGARGLVAKSSDTKEWEILEIRDVIQEAMTFPGGQAADWYFGVANVDAESVKLTVSRNGAPAIEDDDFLMYPDEGFVQFHYDMDETPAPSVALRFNPGPPFRAGDVSWNAVLTQGDTVTIAGEFGMIFQTNDGGETWYRRDGKMIPREPSPAYWVAGANNGELMWLTAAAGVSSMSTDGGKTWTSNPKPGREGIFGILLEDDGMPIIAGAVGLLGTQGEENWSLADRTELRLLSWMKTPMKMPDGSVLVTGGRSTVIRYTDGAWTRVNVTQ